jgi:hypothetical protein
MTTQKAVTMPTEKGNGDEYDEDRTTESPGRGPRDDGSGSTSPKQR